MVAVDDAYAAANKQKFDQWTAVFDQAVLSWWLPSTNFVWLTFCKVAWLCHGTVAKETRRSYAQTSKTVTEHMLKNVSDKFVRKQDNFQPIKHGSHHCSRAVTCAWGRGILEMAVYTTPLQPVPVAIASAKAWATAVALLLAMAVSAVETALLAAALAVIVAFNRHWRTTEKRADAEANVVAPPE